jgi:hypothetical protein
VLSQLNTLSSDVLNKVRIKELAKPPKDLQMPDLEFMYFQNKVDAGDKLEALLNSNEQKHLNYSFGAISTTRYTQRPLNMSLESPGMNNTGVRFETSTFLKSEYLNFPDDSASNHFLYYERFGISVFWFYKRFFSKNSKKI